MPTNNSTNSTPSISDMMGETTPTDEASGVETEEVEEETIENKYNEMESYWTPAETQREMNPDNPDVKIFISREIVKDSEEEGEEGDGTEMTVEEAADINRNLAELFAKDKDITNENTTVIKMNGEHVLAMNAIDKMYLTNMK